MEMHPLLEQVIKAFLFIDNLFIGGMFLTSGFVTLEIISGAAIPSIIKRVILKLFVIR